MERLGNRVRVMLADDFAPFRQILRAAFPRLGEWDLVAEASTGAEAVERAAETKPHVVVLDYRMPDGDGVAAAVRILEQAPGTHILIASLSTERQYILRALAAGARAYLSKDDAAASIQHAVKQVLTGGAYLSPQAEWEVTRSAPPMDPVATRQVLETFDREAPALWTCAERIQREAAGRAVEAAFDAYWMALRQGEPISDPQTWLLLSVAAGLAPEPAPLRHAHPSDTAFAKYWSDSLSQRQATQLQEHVRTCRSCYLTWTLAAHRISPDSVDPAEFAALRGTLAGHFASPNEPYMFVRYAERTAKVAQLAASELNLLLGASAREGWLRRDGAAGSWMKTLLGAAIV
jgi:DNA-binding NarL/FixJ family response regulator